MDKGRNAERRGGGRRKKPIADLPSGVGVVHTQNGAGRKYWRVRLGKRFTGGAILKKDFDDLTGARAWIDQHRQQKGDTGRNTYVLSGQQLAEARAAFDRLSGTKLSLTDAVTDALKRHRKPEDALGWEEAEKKWLAAPRKRPLGSRTMQAYNISLGFLKDEMKRKKVLPHQVSKREIQEFLLDDANEWEAATIGHHLRNLNCFFGWLVKEDFRIGNPCSGIPQPEVLTAIRVLTPEAAKLLLEMATGSMRVCVALAMFGGMRTSEIRRLEWKEIGATEIEVGAEKTKTRRNRMIPILTPLAAVLRDYKGSRSGFVAPEHWKTSFENLLASSGYRGESGESTWPTNALRHSFGTYRIADIRSENQVAAEMGNSPAMIHKHYRRVVSSHQVKDFWGIRPDA